jgi:alkylation response protein AidB-like acyl-CoA dehydrogenase
MRGASRHVRPREPILLEDFDDLRNAGYLLQAIPKEFGGTGLKLNEVCQQQRRLARRSAPTALALNMHLIATGVAADLWRRDTSVRVPRP